jgi:osmotically-inducible protein OsmY
MKRLFITGLLLAGGAISGYAANNADNTGRNASDQSVTAQNQSEAQGDRDLTRRIRATLIKESNLSSSAKNVKVITRDGKVTLRGPVKSNQERQAVGNAAAGIAGKNNVNNRIEVQSNQ